MRKLTWLMIGYLAIAAVLAGGLVSAEEATTQGVAQTENTTHAKATVPTEAIPESAPLKETEASAQDAEVSRAAQLVKVEQGQQEGGKKVAYKFQDKNEFNKFSDLLRQRDGLLLRMRVLQSYWDEDQASLKEIVDKLSNTYNVDVMKAYIFDDKNLSLIETEKGDVSVPKLGASPNSKGADLEQAPQPNNIN